MKRYNVVIFLLIFANVAFAQIGYQVSLLNSATGQPRAGETVTVDIKLTNCENATVYTTQQKATSNDFGVLSLSVGDTKTFDELDWNKLPLYIEVSIDGVLIAKGQVLSVPVAEYAKKSGFVLTKEFLASKTWKFDNGSRIFSFLLDGTGVKSYGGTENYVFRYYIVDGKLVFTVDDGEGVANDAFMYIPNINALWWFDESLVVQ